MLLVAELKYADSLRGLYNFNYCFPMFFVVVKIHVFERVKKFVVYFSLFSAVFAPSHDRALNVVALWSFFIVAPILSIARSSSGAVVKLWCSSCVR